MNAHAFVEFLVREGAIQATKFDSAVEASSVSGDRADTAVLELGLASESIVLEKLGRYSNSRTVSAAELAVIPAEIAGLISPRVARRFGVVPFFRDGKTLHFAALEPGDLLIQDELGLLTGCMITTFAVLEVRLKEALTKYYGAERSMQMEGLARRLSGRDSGRSGKHVLTGIQEHSTRPVTPQPSLRERHREESARRRTGMAPAELEMSEEDMALFPSMAEGPSDIAPTEQESAPAVSPHGLTEDGESGREDQTTIQRDTANETFEKTIEARLAHAAEALQSAEMRDEIADVLLEFTRPILSRRMLLTLRGDTIVGWRGEGPGVEPTAVRAIAIPKIEPSVFLGLIQGTAFWLGPLPPMIRNQELLFALGDPDPQACLILPVKVRGKIVAFLYGDCLAEPLGALPMAEFRRLLAKTDVAFQVYLLKAKIRTL
ncbi:MAG: hypothetical protein K8R59_10525 [Thermoanaerobaculales bacterium]|nr:hypothetical protein [Thermoanaerobaculales bacterium]